MTKPESKATKALLALSTGIGALVAVLADVVQKEQASAVATIANSISRTLRIDFDAIWAVILIVAVAASLSIVFEPQTKQRAFYLGTSVLAMLLTVVPYELPPGFASGTSAPSPHAAVPSEGRLLRFAAYMRSQQDPAARVSLVLASQRGQGVSGAVVTLLSLPGRAVVAQARTETDTLSFSQPAGSYLVRVEAPGYAILEHNLTLSAGSSSTVRLELRPSWVPLGIQRLFKS